MKSGYKTTEFWLTVMTNVVSIAVAAGVLPDSQSEAFVQVGAFLAMLIVNAVYTNARAKVKAGN